MKITIIIFTFLLVLSCNSKHKKTIKISDTDLFKKTIIKSQAFKIKGKKDVVLEADNGILIVIPENSFVDENGKTVKGNIEIEFSSTNNIDEMILSNFTSIIENNPLQSENVFFINAKNGDKQLYISSDNPIYIEIPTSEEINEFSIYEGIRDEDGNMKWKNPKEITKYLVSIDLDLLNFLPERFDKYVKANISKINKTYTKARCDSLYYNLNTKIIPFEKLNRIPDSIYLNQNVEDLYNWYYEDNNSTIITNDSIVIMNVFIDTTLSSNNICGVKPVSIKTIKSKKFQNTFISTREFEKRIKKIINTCDNDILELYVNNLDKNLWEVDKMVYEKLGKEDSLYNKFKEFSEQKLTNVNYGNKQIDLLSAYYDKQLKEIEQELKKNKEKYLKEIRIKDKLAEKTRLEYVRLLKKRQKYRLNKFGFKLTKTGWYNIAKMISIEDLDKFDLNVQVSKTNQFDRTHVYVVNKKIKSVFSLLSNDAINYNNAYSDDRHLLMWKKQKANIIIIAYKNEKTYFDNIEFTVEKNNFVAGNPIEINDNKLKYELKKLKRYKKENKIEVDLNYQQFFHNEKNRVFEFIDEQSFTYILQLLAFPCCFEKNKHLY